MCIQSEYKLAILNSLYRHLVDVNSFHYFRHLPKEINHTLKYLCFSMGSAGEWQNKLRCMHHILGMRPNCRQNDSFVWSPDDQCHVSMLKHIVLNSHRSSVSFFREGISWPPSILRACKTMYWRFSSGRRISAGLILSFPIPSGHLLYHCSDSLYRYSSSVFCVVLPKMTELLGGGGYHQKSLGLFSRQPQF